MRVCAPHRSPTREPATQVILRHRSHGHNIWCSPSGSGTTSCALARLRQPPRSRPGAAPTPHARPAGFEVPRCRRRNGSGAPLAPVGDGRPRCPDPLRAAGPGRLIPHYRRHAGTDSVDISLRRSGSAPTPGLPWSGSIRLSRTLLCMRAPGLSGSTSFELPCDGRPRGAPLSGIDPGTGAPSRSPGVHPGSCSRSPLGFRQQSGREQRPQPGLQGEEVTSGKCPQNRWIPAKAGIHTPGQSPTQMHRTRRIEPAGVAAPIRDGRTRTSASAFPGVSRDPRQARRATPPTA